MISDVDNGIFGAQMFCDDLTVGNSVVCEDGWISCYPLKVVVMYSDGNE